MAKTIFMVRHGEPEDGYTKRYLGRLNPGLSPKGAEQAAQIAKAIVPLAPNRCLSSPLRRARETADIIARACGLETEPHGALLEIDFGNIEGLTFQEASDRYPDSADSWHSISKDFDYPGGEDYAAFNRRAAAMAELAKAAPDDRLLLVAHGGILRGVLCNLLGIPANGPLRFRLAYAALSIVEIGEDGSATLVGFNLGQEFSILSEHLG